MRMEWSAPWHKASFEHFLTDTLPRTLTRQLPLVDFTVIDLDRYHYELQMTFACSQADITVTYTNLPRPNDEGVFLLNHRPYIVVPYAASDDLANTAIYCVGEQLLAALEQHLHSAMVFTDNWTEDLIHAALPLDKWITSFFNEATHSEFSTLQPLNELNWLARTSHLRLLYVKDRQLLFSPGHLGRTCPYETPEGPNIARILPLALGATIENGRLIIKFSADNQPLANLGLSASMIPLLEHSHPQRLLMGSNMMRQWLTPPDPEPALVQSGNEPEDVATFWCGRNLCTAFISWGSDTFDDAVVISESCAQRLNYPTAIEPGDKLSTRHGIKGVVSRILPDNLMPRLTNGQVVDIVYNFIHFHTRHYFGNIREALLGRIAHQQQSPVVAPPFAGPDEATLQAQLAQYNLPANGMETLVDGTTGLPLTQASMVGWIYWGKLNHVAHEKFSVNPDQQPGRRLGDLEYYALRDADALITIHELFHNQNATDNSDLQTPGSPQWKDLARRLNIIGIQAQWKNQALTFHLDKPQEETIALAQPVAHPWLIDQTCSFIGNDPLCQQIPSFQALMATNKRLERMLRTGTPQSLQEATFKQLTHHFRAFCEALITPAQLQFEARIRYSGRAVATPGLELTYDQVGIPQEMAWRLFSPLLKQSSEQYDQEKNYAALDEVMQDRRVLVHRAPSLGSQAFIACRPVRETSHTIRLHPLVSRLLQADFDGDQVAIFLPLAPEAQTEIAATLSPEAHLTRQPRLLRQLIPDKEIMWGLAELSLPSAPEEQREVKEKSLDEISEIDNEILAEKNQDYQPQPGLSSELSGSSDDPLLLYLHEIAHVPLLTPEEETNLIQLMQQGRQQSARFVPDRQIIEEGQQAQQRLTEANLRLVVSVAKKYIGHGINLLDLIQEGNIGLMRAIENFDSAKKYTFHTYARWWIKQAITRAIAHLVRTRQNREQLQGQLQTLLQPSSAYSSSELVTHSYLTKHLQEILKHQGARPVLQQLHQLIDIGLTNVKASGASIQPFMSIYTGQITQPDNDTLSDWQCYHEIIIERLEGQSITQATNTGLEPQLLAIKSGAQGTMQQLIALLAAPGPIIDINSSSNVIRHSYSEGLTPPESYNQILIARQTIAHMHYQIEQFTDDIRQRTQPTANHILARAMRSPIPGITFAYAAQRKEQDPLTDLDSRLFTGLTTLVPQKK